MSECLCVFGGGTYTLLGSCSKIALLFGTIETNQYGIEERERHGETYREKYKERERERGKKLLTPKWSWIPTNLINYFCLRFQCVSFYSFLLSPFSPIWYFLCASVRVPNVCLCVFPTLTRLCLTVTDCLLLLFLYIFLSLFIISP